MKRILLFSLFLTIINLPGQQANAGEGPSRQTMEDAKKTGNYYKKCCENCCCLNCGCPLSCCCCCACPVCCNDHMGDCDWHYWFCECGVPNGDWPCCQCECDRTRSTPGGFDF